MFSLRNIPKRVERIAGLTDLAIRLGQPPWNVMRAPWRAAVELVRFELLPRVIRQNIRTACDVGANRGDWTAALLELAQPDSILAFEPNPKVYSELASRFANSSCVKCVQAAVGATSGTATFNVESMSELSSIRRLTESGRAMHGVESLPTSQIQVQVVTLDQELQTLDEITLLKLDVQGYEDQVIAGGRESLRRCRCLVCEVIYDQNYYASALPFLDLARLIEDVSPLRLSCVSEPTLSSDGFGVWADAVFLRV